MIEILKTRAEWGTLTDPQKKFVQLVCSGMALYEAAQEAFSCQSSNAIRSRVSKLKKHPVIGLWLIEITFPKPEPVESAPVPTPDRTETPIPWIAPKPSPETFAQGMMKAIFGGPDGREIPRFPGFDPATRELNRRLSEAHLNPEEEPPNPYTVNQG